MNTIKFYFYWYSGLLRLRIGLCPSCNSGPPERRCFVCEGDTDYGIADKQHDPMKYLEWKSRYLRGLQERYL